MHERELEHGHAEASDDAAPVGFDALEPPNEVRQPSVAETNLRLHRHEVRVRVLVGSVRRVQPLAVRVELPHVGQAVEAIEEIGALLQVVLSIRARHVQIVPDGEGSLERVSHEGKGEPLPRVRTNPAQIDCAHLADLALGIHADQGRQDAPRSNLGSGEPNTPVRRRHDFRRDKPPPPPPPGAEERVAVDIICRARARSPPRTAPATSRPTLLPTRRAIRRVQATRWSSMQIGSMSCSWTRRNPSGRSTPAWLAVRRRRGGADREFESAGKTGAAIFMDEQ